MADVFISYTHEDQPAAQLIADRLAAEGFSVFFDHVAIVAGETFSSRIDAEIHVAKAILALLSSKSRKNQWVVDELQAALETKAVVIPVLLDADAKDNWLWPLLGTRQSVELDLRSADRERQLDNLVRTLSAAIGERERGIAKSQLRPPEASPAASSAPSKVFFWVTVAIAVASAVLSALVTLLISR